MMVNRKTGPHAPDTMDHTSSPPSPTRRPSHPAAAAPSRPGPDTTRRRLLLAAGACMLGAGAPLRAQPGDNAALAGAGLRLIGEARLPHAMTFQGSAVGGLSGIDYDPASELYHVISDEASAGDPARFFTLRMALDDDQLGQPEVTGMTRLRQADGSAYDATLLGTKLLDPEAIRWRAATGTVLWTSEGNALAGAAPSLNESRRDGTLLRQFRLPAQFEFQIAQARGPRINLSLEGLALSPDGRTAWLSMEAPMRQDGPVPTPEAPGGPCRITSIDLDNGRAMRQIAYVPDAIPRAPRPASAHADNGISEILMLDADRMLVLERAYMAGYGTDLGNSLRLYLIDTRQGSDTLEVPVLQAGNHQPVTKTLVADFSSFVGPGAGTRLSRLDNTEGMTWGPVLPTGRRSLVFISDNNFSSRQITQVLAFEFLG
ncbi:MAG: esterase-like of phytase family protein, partial [Polaromonas sp.]|nr:esterase-like of phytase family protein [Polaromonas sp.]